jgi:hypothetical protein
MADASVGVNSGTCSMRFTPGKRASRWTSLGRANT